MVKSRGLPFDALNFMTRSELSPTNLKNCLESAKEKGFKGVSVCIRTEKGSEERGGYIFHYRSEDDYIELLYFPFDEGYKRKLESWKELHELISHVIGKEWNEDMWKLSQKISTRDEEAKESSSLS